MKPFVDLLMAIMSQFLTFHLLVQQAQAQDASKTCTVDCKRTGQQKNVTCLLDPESVEGPYYLPLHLLRSNVTEDRTGIPLTLHLGVVDSNSCTPVQGVTVDIWHADAHGVYSGYVQTGASSPNTTFLRGIQVTDKNGVVRFDTIYPGWYPGRCIHIHVEVYVSGALKHTGQLYFPESLTEASRTVEPYASRTTSPLSLAKDGIYVHDGGAETTFDHWEGDVKPSGPGSLGLVASMYIGIDPKAVRTRGRGRNERPKENSA